MHKKISSFSFYKIIIYKLKISIEQKLDFKCELIRNTRKFVELKINNTNYIDRLIKDNNIHFEVN